jgi:hypothetical protein
MQSAAAAEFQRSKRAGFTLAETAFSTVIVGMVVLAGLRTVVVSAQHQTTSASTATGTFLANDLLSEILPHYYQERVGRVNFGTEDNEAGATRAKYDDVDDYHGYAESPPRKKDGTALINSLAWRRSVTVDWVEPTNVMNASQTETGLKRISVVVTFRGKPVASCVGLRANVR